MEEHNKLVVLTLGSILTEGAWLATEHIPNLFLVSTGFSVGSLMISAYAGWSIRNYARHMVQQKIAAADRWIDWFVGNN